MPKCKKRLNHTAILGERTLSYQTGTAQQVKWFSNKGRGFFYDRIGHPTQRIDVFAMLSPKDYRCPVFQDIGNGDGFYKIGLLSELRGSDFGRIGQVAQKMLIVTKEHDADNSAQVVPILLFGTELGAAVLIAAVAQL